jgi:hypothetical protein
MEKAMLVICSTLTMALPGIVKILQGPNLYLYSVTSRERESGDFRLVAVPRAGDEKPRDNDLYLFCSGEYSTFFIFLYRSNGVIFNFDIYLYFTWKN